MLLTAGDGGGSGLPANLALRNGALEIEASKLELRDNDNVVLAVDGHVVEINSAEIFVDSTAGLTVQGSIQTTDITNERSRGLGLTIESLSQALQLQVHFPSNKN